MSRPTLADLSPKFQAQAVAQLHNSPRPRTVSVAPVPDLPPARPVPKKRLRQKTEKLNATEQAFERHLVETMPEHAHHAQAITLRLANGVRYTPDFMSFSKMTGLLIAHEVKGFMRDDAAVKLKVAAALYPAIKFRLASKRKGGGWDVQEVLP